MMLGCIFHVMLIAKGRLNSNYTFVCGLVVPNGGIVMRDRETDKICFLMGFGSLKN